MYLFTSIYILIHIGMLRPPRMQEDVHGPPAANAQEGTGLCLLSGGSVSLNPVIPVQTALPIYNKTSLRGPPHPTFTTVGPPGGIFFLLTGLAGMGQERNCRGRYPPTALEKLHW